MQLKTASLRKNIAFIKLNPSFHNNFQEMLEGIKEYIASKECKHNIILDITALNFLEAIRMGVLAATYHFVEFPAGKAYIVVSDFQVKKYIELFNLSNIVVIYNQNELVLDNIA